MKTQSYISASTNSHLAAKGLIALLALGCVAANRFGLPAWAAANQNSPAAGTPRVIVQTSFEAGQATNGFQAAQHKLAKGVAHTGEYAMVGEVTQPNQAVTLEIPFQVKQGNVIRVSFWIRSDQGAACSTFVRVGKERKLIGDRPDKVATSTWKQVLAVYRPQTNVTGVIQINAPSSWNGKVGKVWIDDLAVMETDDECQFPERVTDFPAIACDGQGHVWMAVLERPARRKQIGIYRMEQRRRKLIFTLPAANLTGVGAPAIAVTEKGCVVAFPAERKGAWQIAYAFVDDKSSTAPSCKFIASEGKANISPAVAVVGNRAWILWESNAGTARGIYACQVDRKAASQPQRLSADSANSYNPALVALEDGSLFAAWDSARDKNIKIYGAWFRDGKWQAEQRITSDARIERHPALAVWKNQVWMTWQASSYPERQLNRNSEQLVLVARLDGATLSAPKHLFEQVSTEEKLLLRPRIAFNSAGRLWLTARESIHQTAGWRPMAWCYSGDRWSEAQVLLGEPGRWRPINLTLTPNGLMAACQFDNLPQGRANQGIHPDLLSGVATAAVSEPGAQPARPLEVEPLKTPPTGFSLAEKIALCCAEFPKQTIKHGGKELHLFWGNLHEHTDLSACGRAVNPPGHDLFANVRDIERLDFCALTDHDFDFDFPQWDYNGEQTRNNHDPGRFVTFLGEEWTSSKNPPAVPGNPNRYGHHNLIFLDPFHDRFYDAYDGDITPADLWRQMEGVEFVCIPHQLADWLGKGKGNPPTDWTFTDEKLQPLAEIFQARQSYEYLGCPRQATHGAPFKGYYLQDAWAKGIVIGTIASSDHGGGNGKAGVWAEKLTRESLFEAMRARHTFGTSGSKMSLFFGTDTTMMGDKVQHPGKPIAFQVHALALHDIKELVIFRNNQIVHRVEPNEKQLDVKWTDAEPPNETLWYYARIHTADDELAWSSPIWFTVSSK